MHDERLDERTRRFLADLATFRAAAAPPPGEELRSLFASNAPVAVAAIPLRRASAYKRLVTTVPSRVAAGVLGALLAGSVGAGAVTGTMTLTANEGEDAPTTVTETVPLAEDEPKEEETPEAEESKEEEEPKVDEEPEPEADDAETAEDDLDLSGATVPTSVSHAARIHAFDEACGNHGAYVSAFARTGAEPECATEFRASGGLQQPAGDDAGATAQGEQGTADGTDEGTKASKGKSAGKGEGAERSKAARGRAAERRGAKG